ncbi:hypothetical protein MKX03_023013 [Papaver bracteatum]|nr:hypothetical protein MKX03_023013 [Papaver bracteatum]
MMNKYISNGDGDNEICNTNNPSMVSFVGLDTNNQKHFGEWETNNISSHHQQHHHHQPTATNNNHNNVNPNFLNSSSTTNNNNNIFENFNNNFLSTTPHSSTLFPSNNFFSSTSSSSTYNNNNNSTQFLDFPPSSSTSTNFFLKNKPQLNSSSSFDGSGLYYNSINNDYRRIGLNLGHRTYFSSRESTMMLDRLVRRPRGFYLENQVPRCQAEGCNVELTHAKHYHRRHKVCEFHSKATKVVAGGIEQRFCQQCSRFHVLAEFDESKRSCRKRLADHNRRRRKPHQPSGPYNETSSTSSAVKPVASENGNLRMGSSSSRSSSELVAAHDHNSNQQQDMSLSSSSATLSLMIPKCTTTNNNHKSIPTTKAADTSSLMTHFISNSCSPPSSGPHHSPHEHNPSQPFITTEANSPSAVSLSSYQNLFFPNVNSNERHHREEDDHDEELTLQQSTGDQHGASTTSEIDHEDLHNLLHLRQAMFGVEFV